MACGCRWGHVLLLDLIGLSGRYPHISGFYKLILIVAVTLDGAGYFDGLPGSVEGQQNQTRPLFSPLLCARGLATRSEEGPVSARQAALRLPTMAPRFH